MLRVVFNNSLFSLQKLCISSELRGCLGVHNGDTVTVNINSDISIICQIFLKKDFNRRFCELNKSVIVIKNFDSLKICRNLLTVANIELQSSSKYLSLSDIKIVSVNNLRNVSISVILKDVHLTLKWKSQNTLLKTIIKEILKYFVVSTNAVIFPENVTVCNKIGIYCLIIHSTDSAYGKIISSTNIVIDDIISKNWIQCDKFVPHLSGMNEISKKLKEYCVMKNNDSSSSSSLPFNFNVSM